MQQFKSSIQTLFKQYKNPKKYTEPQSILFKNKTQQSKITHKIFKEKLQFQDKLFYDLSYSLFNI